MKDEILAFDLGGSHVAAAVVNDHIGPITWNHIPQICTLESLLSIIEATGQSALRSSGTESIAGIGLAAPGPFDYENGTSLMKHKLQALYGYDVRDSLGSVFGVPPHHVVFLNDATAFLLGEMTRSALGGMERVVGITLGTGIGSAFVSKGQVVVEGPGVPAEGYVYNLPWAGETVEDKISTRSLMKMYRDSSGEEISVKEIANRATADPIARKVMKQFGATLGEALQGILKVFDPQLLVLGGGITRSFDLFELDMVRQFTSIRPRIHVCDRVDEAPLIGAARIALAKCSHQ